MKKIDMYNMEINVWVWLCTGTEIMRVPGGWLYKVAHSDGTQRNPSLQFVPFNKEYM